MDRTPSSSPDRPLAVVGADRPVLAKGSGYPEPFRSRVQGRDKRVLGDLFGLA